MNRIVSTFAELKRTGRKGPDAAIAEDDVYVRTPNYILDMDVSQWGWVHLLLGVVLILSGLGVMTGNVLARTVGVFIAALSAIANFAFIPYYPIWSIAIISTSETIPLAAKKSSIS